MITLIPAIDLMNGQIVRLSQGNYSRVTEYSESPTEVAKKFYGMGYKRLHIVDLDAAGNTGRNNLHVLKEITSSTSIKVDFGGGLRETADVEKAFACGAFAVSIGSIAVKKPETVKQMIEKFGPEKIILSSDVLDGKIRIHGWTENSGKTVQELLEEYIPLGIRTVLCTDISRDGMMCGPNIELYSEIMKRFPDCDLIASGGIRDENDIKALNEAGIPSVVFGKAIYEGRIDMKDLIKQYNQHSKCLLRE